MAKVVLIGIARMGSSRLPGKVLFNLDGTPVIDWIVKAGIDADLVDDVIIATTTDPRDQAIADWCAKSNVKYFRGSEDDVLLRFYGAAKMVGADVAIRVTCDCPLIDPNVIDQIVALQQATDADYVSNTDPPTWPDGMDCEAIKFSVLEQANREATSKIDRECVTTWIVRNQHRFKTETLICPLPDMHKERWVLDTEDDWRLIRNIVSGCCGHTGWLSIKYFLDRNAAQRGINKHHPRNERFYEALANEPIGTRSYANSRKLLSRAKKTIPLGTQTFSKSEIQYPQDSPLFVTHGDGGYCFDVDGNRYIDLVGGLLPVILGHRDPDVDCAIRSQLNRGISFSLATELEAELSEMLCRLIPCAEMVRLGKNGTDVTTAAIRLARVCTGRDYIVSSGYHGWADWTVAHDCVRNAGVPQVVRDKTIALRHGDSDFLVGLRDRSDIACVVVEPETDAGFLYECRRFCDHTGAILIFDEIITWPRWGLGGAQDYYGVIPDLACISKAMANGMPISALVGKRKFMSYMDRTSFSGTFFSETLSIAAAIATIRKLEAEDVVGHLKKQTIGLRIAIEDMIPGPVYGHFSLSHNPLTRLYFKDNDIKTLFMREMAATGTLIIATHNLSYAHGPNEIKRVLKSYEHTLGYLAEVIESGDIKEQLRGPPIPAHANVRATV